MTRAELDKGVASVVPWYLLVEALLHYIRLIELNVAELTEWRDDLLLTE